MYAHSSKDRDVLKCLSASTGIKHKQVYSLNWVKEIPFQWRPEKTSSVVPYGEQGTETYFLTILNDSKKRINLFMFFAPINMLQSHSKVLQSQ